MTMHEQIERAQQLSVWFAAAALLSLPLIDISRAATADKTQTAAPPASKSVAGRVPDWNGVWVVADFFMDKQDSHASVATPPRASTIAKRMAEVPPPVMPKLKGKYLEQGKQFRMAMMKGQVTSDPLADCLPQGLALFWNGPYAFEIMQTPKQINFFQEWNEQTHRVYLDGRKHPEDPNPTFNGHSIGHWQGDTLMVDSIGFTTDSLMDMGIGHSEAMHITESMRSLAPDLIEITQTIADPEALEEPWTRITRLRRKPDMEVMEYVCAQNNRNKTNADGTTGLQLHSDSK
jgi:hypothetical protein